MHTPLGLGELQVEPDQPGPPLFKVAADGI